jgi:rod shape-determining protein MreB
MIFGRDIGIDLGTSTTIVAVRGKGVVTKEPSVVAMDRNTGRLLKVGMAAHRMLGRTPGNIVAISPIEGGVISDFDMTERMLRELLRKVISFSLFKPRLVIAVPSCITEVEERAVIDAGLRAGARKVYLMEDAVAAALGAGLDISKAEGSMIVDVGAGTTDVAVLSLSGVVQAESIKKAGDSMNDAIIKFIKRKHGLLIGDITAEDLKKNIGCVYPRPDTATVEIKGRCLMTGLPRMESVSTGDMVEALEEPAQNILETVHQVLESTPPELVGDIADNGITLTGGGSLIWGLDELIEDSTHIAVHISDDAELCVAYGLLKSLEWIDDMHEGTIGLSRRKQMK